MNLEARIIAVMRREGLGYIQAKQYVEMEEAIKKLPEPDRFQRDDAPPKSNLTYIPPTIK